MEPLTHHSSSESSNPVTPPDSVSDLPNVRISVKKHSDSMTPLPSDDIPEALRDSTTRSPSLASQRKFPIMWVALIGVGAIALGAATALLWQPIMSLANQNSELEPRDSSPSLSSPDERSEGVLDGELLQGEDSQELLGHRFYEEVDEALLVPVVGDGSVLLQPAAAESFAEMVEAARADGVRLQPLSGFRTLAQQDYLFFEIKKGRKQAPSERAAVSAPPGYSEHHTGYALDIGDATQPSTNVDESFEETAAFDWLQDNAAAYSFELSFDGEADGLISYEPWHWRFVGDRDSLETFYGENIPAASEDPSSDIAVTEEQESDASE